MTTEPNRMGFCAEFQAINYHFIILHHILIILTTLKAFDAENPIVILCLFIHLFILFIIFFWGGTNGIVTLIEIYLQDLKNTLELTSQMSERSRTSASDSCLMFNDCKWYITLLPSATIYIPKFTVKL